MGKPTGLADAVADRLETSDLLADAVAAKLGGQLHEIRGQLLGISYQMKELAERLDALSGKTL